MKYLSRITLSAIAALLLTLALSAGSAVAQDEEPVNNPYGAHLVDVQYNKWIDEQLDWIRHLVGPRGYVKFCLFQIDKNTQGVTDARKQLVEEIYKRDLIPIVRLGGVWQPGGWLKPEADAPGDYTSISEAIKRVVDDLPRHDDYPLYVEIYNEPNLSVEWTGEPNLEEYGHFFVDAAAAIRSIGDDRIQIMNGAFALSAEATEEMFEAVPESVHAFDVWATHPYPQNRPPEVNLENGITTSEGLCIDAYKLERDVVRKYRGEDVPIMITETGYDLGNGVFSEHPIITDELRADYITRAFRDYWVKDPQLLAVTPFLFMEKGWERFNWVEQGSSSKPDGLPERPYLQYNYVSMLAKPTEETGAINGRVYDDMAQVGIEDATILCSRIGEDEWTETHTDSRGLYFLPKMEPGAYTVQFYARNYTPLHHPNVIVTAGENLVLDEALHAHTRGVLEGTVTDGASGDPLEGATVSFTPGEGSVTTGADGKFQLDDLAPVRGMLMATMDGYTAHRERNVLPAGQVYKQFDLKIAPSDLQGATNLVFNTSFEQGLGEKTINNIALRWELLLGGEFEVTDEHARTGKASQAIMAMGGNSAARQITHYGTAVGGATYSTSVWIKTEDLDGKAWLDLSFTDNSGGALETHASETKVSGDADWTKAEVTATCPENDFPMRVSVQLHIDADKGTAYYDDAVLEIVEE